MPNSSEWNGEWRPIGFDARIPLELVPDDQRLTGCRHKCGLGGSREARCTDIPDDHQWLFYSYLIGSSKYVPITYNDIMDWSRPEDYYRSRRSENTVVLNESPGSYLDDPRARAIIEPLLPKHHNYIEPNADERSFTTTDGAWKSTQTLRKRYIEAGYAQSDFVVCELAYVETEDVASEYPVVTGGTLVGYEVCNVLGHSAIHADWHSPDDLLWLREKYARHLNDRLLFSEAEAASSFLKDTNRLIERVPTYDDLPYTVVAMVLLPEGLERVLIQENVENAYITNAIY